MDFVRFLSFENDRYAHARDQLIVREQNPWAMIITRMLSPKYVMIRERILQKIFAVADMDQSYILETESPQ